MEFATIDKSALKALLSDTRIKIIKSLNKRNMMVAELAKLLNIRQNSVNKHLKKLKDAGFVTRVDDNKRKWVYYQLTQKSLDLLSSSETHVDIDIFS